MIQKYLGAIGRLGRYYGMGLVLMGLATPVVAAGGWQVVTDQSAIQFMSVKNKTISERHSFKTFSGSIDQDGKAVLRIDLHSAETNIPIRNERLRSMLFHGESEAVFRVRLAAGFETQTEILSGSLQLNGIKRQITLPVEVVHLSDRQIFVYTLEPFTIDATDYGLLPGLEALREVAGLMGIEPLVPVTFTLLWQRDQ